MKRRRCKNCVEESALKSGNVARFAYNTHRMTSGTENKNDSGQFAKGEIVSAKLRLISKDPTELPSLLSMT